MSVGISLLIRIVQALFSLIVLSLSSYVANWYIADTLTSSPSQINFLIFSALWSLLSVVYLEIVPRFIPRASHPYAAVILEVTNVIFWFSGFVALAVFLSQLLFCRGSVCGSAQADTVFAASLFVSWGVSILLLAKDVFKMGFRTPPSAARSAAPGMRENLA